MSEPGAWLDHSIVCIVRGGCQHVHRCAIVERLAVDKGHLRSSRNGMLQICTLGIYIYIYVPVMYATPPWTLVLLPLGMVNHHIYIYTYIVPRSPTYPAESPNNPGIHVIWVALVCHLPEANLDTQPT